MKTVDGERGKGAIASACAALGKKMRGGLAARIFSSYDTANKLLNDSAAAGIVRGLTEKKDGVLRRIRKRISRGFENSTIAKAFSYFADVLLGASVKAYGAFLFSFGAYTLLTYFMQAFVFDAAVAESTPLFAGAALCAAIPLLVSSQTLGVAIESGFLFGKSITDVFGARANRPGAEKARSVRFGLPVLCGVVCGAATYFVSPAKIVLSLFAAIAVWFVACCPEAGVVLLIFCVPFVSLAEAPSFVLGLMVAVTALSYLFKLIRGKRVFKFGIAELGVLAFLLLTLSGGITANGKADLYPALMHCAMISACFLAVNLIRTKKQLLACLRALVVSAAITSGAGILQYMAGQATSGMLDGSLFGGISGRADAFFGNPNVLAFYLIAAFPSVLALLFIKGKRKTRAFAFVASVLTFVCVILTWSRAAWVGMAFSVILFLLSISALTLAFLPCFAGGAALAALLLPGSFGARLSNFASRADTANAYRLKTWANVWQMLGDNAVCGIGAGNASFERVYSLYASAGTETLPHSHSLYMQLVLQFGILGVLLLGVAIFFSAQKCISFAVRKGADAEIRIIALASLSGMVALLATGVFDYTWYSYRVEFLFWALAGISSAAVDLGSAELQKEKACDAFENTSEFAEVLIPVCTRGEQAEDVCDKEE